MARYWVFHDGRVQGPVDIPSLRKIPGFTLLTQVCAEGESGWRMADEVVEIKSYFLAPPRVSSMPVDVGNTVAVPAPMPAAEPSLIETLPPMTPIQLTVESPDKGAIEPPKEAPPASGGALRVSCAICGYKNPRDVATCMKCGTPIAAASAEEKAKTPVKDEASKPIILEPAAPPSPLKTPAPTPAAAAPAAPPVDPKAGTMVEIPITRILILLVAGSLIGGLGFVGSRYWKKHHLPKAKKSVAPVVSAPVAKPVRKAVPSRHRYDHPQTKSKVPVMAQSALAEKPDADTTEAPDKSASATGSSADDQAQPSSYGVLSEAAPVRHRQAAPVNSPYAEKRRANKGLWMSQEDQAIAQVQNYRIYGGQRTIQRNTEILMQILRDREYSSAFESGKKPSLYNDVDWGAGQNAGPQYDVRLTFSGGREQDGSVRKPLKFAFLVDLERGSVEPGGDDLVRSNTMHAFFDESRIPPEERRDIAKDTEELVQAAQPGASPLALDTVARHFGETYGLPALTRVTTAYHLDILNKKIIHDKSLVSDVTPAPPKKSSPSPTRSEGAKGAAASSSGPSAASTFDFDSKNIPKKAPNKSFESLAGAVQFEMEKGSGKERTVKITVPTNAKVTRLWETVTDYDRLKQFVPDMLVSEREGQDGLAVIVHTVSLTRLLFFVFKVNMHLRVIEHPIERTLEFERIAGEFESFRGSLQIVPSGNGQNMVLHATVVPKSHVPEWALRDMAKHFLIPVLDAVRTRAENQ